MKKHEILFPRNLKISDEELFDYFDNEYSNYHKHCHYSNVFMTDSVARPVNYIIFLLFCQEFFIILFLFCVLLLVSHNTRFLLLHCFY